MKFFYSAALLLSAFAKQALALSELGAFGDITYSDEGLPTEVNIAFTSDYAAVDTPATDNDISFTAALSGTAWDGNYYTNQPTLAVTTGGGNAGTEGNGNLAITLPAAVPPVGEYTVILNVDMNIRNQGSPVLMHEKQYSITVNLIGQAKTVLLQTTDAATTTTYAETTITDDKTATVVSPNPAGLLLAQVGTNTAFGSDIVVKATNTDSGYKMWRDDAVVVKVYDNAAQDTLLYEWPEALVEESSNSEVGTAAADNELTVTLKSAPVALYNQLSIFVEISISFRDLDGDVRTRQLRLAGGDDEHRNLERMGENTVALGTNVKLESTGSGAASGVAKSMLAMSAAAGVALLL